VRRAARALASLGLLVAAAGCGGGGASDTNEADGEIPGVEIVRITSNGHTQGRVDYDRHPPAGGDHNPAAAPCGFYDEAIPDEYVVHSLEHGAVWLAYSPSLSAADLAVVRRLTRAEANVIATPHPDLPAGVAVVATAWARQLPLDSVRDPRLGRFVELYRLGSQAPEGSTGCPPAG
jgi:hypothetical protein